MNPKIEVVATACVTQYIILNVHTAYCVWCNNRP